MLLFGVCLPPPMKETGYFSSIFTVGKLYCHLMAASIELALPLELAKYVSEPFDDCLTVLHQNLYIG